MMFLHSALVAGALLALEPAAPPPAPSAPPAGMADKPGTVTTPDTPTIPDAPRAMPAEGTGGAPGGESARRASEPPAADHQQGSNPEGTSHWKPGNSGTGDVGGNVRGDAGRARDTNNGSSNTR